MNDRIFKHGLEIECPECPGNGKRNSKPLLICIERNYSVCSIDYGCCEECGKAWCVSYKIDIEKLNRDEKWDGPSRKEREAEALNKQIEQEKKERAEMARLKTKYESKQSERPFSSACCSCIANDLLKKPYLRILVCFCACHRGDVR